MTWTNKSAVYKRAKPNLLDYALHLRQREHIAVAYGARAREPVDAYPTVHVPGVACDTPSAWLAHRMHIRDARTEIYAIGCEACTSSRLSATDRFRRADSSERAPLDTISRSIVRRPRIRSAILHACRSTTWSSRCSMKSHENWYFFLSIIIVTSKLYTSINILMLNSKGIKDIW